MNRWMKSQKLCRIRAWQSSLTHGGGLSVGRVLYAVGVIVFLAKFWMGIKVGTVSPSFADVLNQWWQAFFFGGLIVGLGRLVSLLEKIHQNLVKRSL